MLENPSVGRLGQELPLPSLEQSPWRESGAQKKADDLSADEMAAELKLKEADNKDLQAEVVKLRDNLADKESMLAMLTDGLKEVDGDR